MEELKLFFHKDIHRTIKSLISEIASDRQVSEHYLEFLTNFYSYALVNLLIGWIKNGMKEDDDTIVRQIRTVVSGTINQALKNAEDSQAALLSLEERLQWMRALSATANGTLGGKEKVMLETYVQMTYFERIIRRANTRFMIMSGGQYELKRRTAGENNRSQSGLELDVIDHYNGTERSVRTLSGGESFMAALSLALGLSDEVQSEAGGIRLDTMFVDEGFGSLDEEALRQAMKALMELSEGNRLVGIISHVGELKEQISRQVSVTKERAGGSRAEILLI